MHSTSNSNSAIIPPYAPTTSYGGISSGAARTNTSSISLDHEVRLHTTMKQRELYDSLAELYAIMVSLDFLERAYLRDSVSHSEYTPTCLRLLAQYNGILRNNELAAREFGSLQEFKDKYNLECSHATNRLKVGVPATVEHAIAESAANGGTSSSTSTAVNSGASARAVAEATGNFITCMDALKLNYKAKDQLHPLLSELMTSLNKVTSQDFEGRGKIVQWLITLNALKINEEINEEQARQMLFDLDNAYKVFYTNLE